MSWQNAKILGDGIGQEAYTKDESPRGHPDFVMSRGQLMQFVTNPKRWVEGYEPESTAATDWGSMVDCMALTPDDFASRYAHVEAEYLNIKGGWKPGGKEKWKQDHPGMEPFKESEIEEPTKAVEALKRDDRAWAFLRSGKTQVMVKGEWKEGDVIIPMKGLIDIVPDKGAIGMFAESIGDFKTGRSAALSTWRREVFTRNYHVQAAMYLDMFNCATGEKRNTFLHVVQENVSPYIVGRRFLAEEFIGFGRAKYYAALKLYAKCLIEKAWPSYDDLGAMSIEGWTVVNHDSWMVLQECETPGLDMGDEL